VKPQHLDQSKRVLWNTDFYWSKELQCFQKNDNAIPSKQLTLCTTKLSSKISNHASQANYSTSFISLSYGRHWTSYCNHSSRFNNFLLISCSVILFAFSVTVNGLWAFNTYILCLLIAAKLEKGEILHWIFFQKFQHLSAQSLIYGDKIKLLSLPPNNENVPKLCYVNICRNPKNRLCKLNCLPE